MPDVHALVDSVGGPPSDDAGRAQSFGPSVGLLGGSELSPFLMRSLCPGILPSKHGRILVYSTRFFA